MQRSILPDRPLKLLPRFRNNSVAVIVYLALHAATCAGVGGYKVAGELARIDQEQQVWAHGTPCADSELRATGDGLATEVAITCDTRDGTTLTGTLRTVLSAGWVAWRGQPLEIRYDDSAPPRFAVGRLIDGIPARLRVLRWIGGFYGALALLAVVLMCVFPIRRLRRLQRIAREGDEVEITIDRIHTVRRGNRDTDIRIVWWRAAGQRRLTRSRLDCRNGLAWLHATEPRALGLRSPDGKHAILLTGTLLPLVLSDAERAAAAHALEANGGGMARGPITELADWIVVSPAPPSRATPV